MSCCAEEWSCHHRHHPSRVVPPDLSSPTLHTHEPAYGLCLLVAVVMALQCTLQAAPIQRFKVYTRTISQHFPEFKGWTPTQGYPDMGCGYYSKHLSHENWLLINNAQRAHYNYLESLTANVTLLVAGCSTPCSLHGSMGVSSAASSTPSDTPSFEPARARPAPSSSTSASLTAIALISAFNFAGGRAVMGMHQLRPGPQA